jgi:NADH dehydrogenase
MILVTGGTSFIGRAVLRRLTEFGHPVRTLIEPSRHSPSLPRGVSVDVALAALTDRRSVRASLVGVDTLIHLAVSEGQSGSERELQKEVDGTAVITEAAMNAKVKRILFLSHLGADRSSAYPSMQAKAIAEDQIRNCNVPSTIFRTAILYGRWDTFTTSLAMLLAISPLFFPLPGDGSILLQPLWVEDLATCICWALDAESSMDQTYEIGGPEYLPLERIVRMIMEATSTPRILFTMRPPYLRWIAWAAEHILPQSPVNPLWLDYLAVNRATDLDTVPRVFGLQPSRMEGNLVYLGERNWGWEIIAQQFARRWRSI